MPEGSSSLTKFEEKFKQKGMTFTNQRRVIAEVIINAKGHPDVDEIFLQVKQRDKTAGIATVYRTLGLFVELGLIAKRDFKESKSRYEMLEDRDHNHIIIEDGGIIEFTDKNLEILIKKIVQEKGLVLKDYVIELYCTKK